MLVDRPSYLPNLASNDFWFYQQTKPILKKNDVMLALWFFKRYVAVNKINLKRGTPKIVYIIKMSDQSAF